MVLAFSDDHPSVVNAAQGTGSVSTEGSHSQIDSTMLMRPKVKGGRTVPLALTFGAGEPGEQKAALAA